MKEHPKLVNVARLFAVALFFMHFMATSCRGEMLCPTEHGKRVALLIGNESYSGGISALKTPLKDIRFVENALKAIDFDVLPQVLALKFWLRWNQYAVP